MFVPPPPATAWPFAEARALASRMEKLDGSKDVVLFETGYGPSGLPHIGTFGEVLRTTMVMKAFSFLSEIDCCKSHDKVLLRLNLIHPIS